MNGFILLFLACIQATQASQSPLTTLPSQDSSALQRQVDEALHHVEERDYALSLSLGRRMLRQYPNDWRSWYLRAIATKTHKLESWEWKRLEQVSPGYQREVFRALLGYVESEPNARPALALDLADRHPESALAQALLASSLYSAGRKLEARAAADKALALDPHMFLAGRVMIFSLDTLPSATEAIERSCVLMSAFPYDFFIVSRALSANEYSCLPPRDFDRRLAYYAPVIQTRRTSTLMSAALGRLTQDMEVLPDEGIAFLLESLSPDDQVWWVHRQVVRLLKRTTKVKTHPAAEAFFRELVAAALEASVVQKYDILKDASIALAEILEANDHLGDSYDLLTKTLDELPHLDRGSHFEALAALSAKLGLREDAESYRLRAFMLANPFKIPPSGSTSQVSQLIDHVFPTLPTKGFLNIEGRPITFSTTSRTPRVLVFWSSDCVWVHREAERILEEQRAPDSLLRRYDIEVLWINYQAGSYRDDATKRSNEIGLNPDSVLFLEDEIEERPDEVLRVGGSPWIFVVSPGGKIVYKIEGFRPMGWPDTIERILEDIEAWDQSDRCS